MNKYLFIFGFETPSMVKSNDEYGSDFEDSEAMFIIAPTEKDAIEWGRKTVSYFFDELFTGESKYSTVNDYAHWIEHDPKSVYGAENLNDIPTISAGDETAAEALVSVWLKKA